MLQISYIRQNIDRVKEKLAVKYFAEIEIVDKIVALDDEKRKLQVESENIQSRVNTISKEIGQLFIKGQKDEAANKKQVVGKTNER
jgi:seryl-tRNA synthetase